MTLQLNLPEEIEQRLLAEVRTGRYASLEQAILEKLNRPDEGNEFPTGMTLEQIRHDLDDAWNNRQDAVDGDAVFAQIKNKSAARAAKGK